VTKTISVTIMNLVRSKAGGKCELLVGKVATGFLNKCSCQALASGVTKFINAGYIILVTLCHAA
jgi:hypothetical protein